MPAITGVDEPLLPLAPVGRFGQWSPAIDVRELPDQFIVLADLPGLKRDEVDVTSDGTMLTIAGARHDRLRAGGVPLRLERPTGKLLRTLRLPDGCDGTKLSAQIRDGVLEVYIPKTARNSTSEEGRELACARR